MSLPVNVHTLRVIRVSQLEQPFPDVYRLLTHLYSQFEDTLIGLPKGQVQDTLFHRQLPVTESDYLHRHLTNRLSPGMTTFTRMKAFDDLLKSLPADVIFLVNR